MLSSQCHQTFSLDLYQNIENIYKMLSQNDAIVLKRNLSHTVFVLPQA